MKNGNGKLYLWLKKKHKHETKPAKTVSYRVFSLIFCREEKANLATKEGKESGEDYCFTAANCIWDCLTSNELGVVLGVASVINKAPWDEVSALLGLRSIISDILFENLQAKG